MRQGEFLLLGPVEVRADGEPVGLGGALSRSMLAVLLLQANKAVSIEQMIEAAWGEGFPASARVQVQNRVSALRRVLRDRFPGVLSIGTRGSGYVIQIDDDLLDITRFRTATQRAAERGAAGAYAAARQELTSALALWRGQALDGLSTPYFQAAAHQLEEHRLRALEQRIQFDLRLQHHHEAIPEITALVTEHPYRETFRAMLMLALYRAGRQADALEAYQAARATLADHLGLEPGALLQRLHTAVLRGDASVLHGPLGEGDAATPVVTRLPEPAAAIPQQLPAAAIRFTGREEQLDRLSGQGSGVVAITGSAGVGKTALAVYWAQQARQQFPDGQLFVNLRGFDPAGQPVSPHDALRTLLGGLGVRPDQLPSELDERAALYRSLLAQRRVLLLADNARDADQVRPLLPGGSGCLVLVTSRDQLWSLVAVEDAQSLPLARLSHQHALNLLAHRLGTKRVLADRDAAGEVIRICAALPLALTIAAAVAAGSPETSLRALATELSNANGSLDVLAGWDQASDIRAAFACSYDRLSTPAGELFRLLGLHPGADFSMAAAASLTGSTIKGVRAPVTELVQAHLLDEVAPARFAMHDLLRAYARELLQRCESQPRQRAARIRLLDHYLHGAHTAATLLNPNRSRLELGPPSPGVTLSDMEDAPQALAWFTAERDCLLASVGLAGAAGSDVHVWQIGCSIAGFLTNRGHWRERVEVLSKALQAAQRLNDDTAVAHTHRHLGVALAVRGEAAPARAHYLQALDLFAQLNDDRSRALTYRNLAWLSEQEGKDLDSLNLNNKALALYRQAGDKGGQARALNVIGWDHARLGDFRTSQTYCLQAIPLLQAVGDAHGEAITYDTLGYACHHLGDHEQAIAYFKRALELLAPAGDRYNEAEVHLHLADAMTQTGDPAAEHHRQAALEILDDLDHPLASEIRRRHVDSQGHLSQTTG